MFRFDRKVEKTNGIQTGILWKACVVMNFDV